MASPADLERRIAALERNNSTGPMVSTRSGAGNVRPFQVGFPAQLTSTFSSSTGYSWEQLVFDPTSGTSVPSVPNTGDYAHTPDNNTSLASGTEGWMEVDPQAGGYLFMAGYTPPATNTATSVAGGWLAGLLSTSCLSLTVLGGSGACSAVDTTQVLTLVYSTGTWASTTNFTYPAGSGSVVLSITSDGLPKLTIGGVAGVGDGGGIDSNGDCFFDFAFGGTTLCDGTATACCGNIFRVRLKCTECPIATECCPARLLPRTLYVTFSGATGDCTCMEGVTLTLSWLSGSSWATADGVSTPIPGCPTANNVYYTFTCASSLAGWQFATSGYTGPPTSYSITFASSGYSRTQACDGSTPLLVTWTAVPVSGNCTGTINITITETHP